jgi:hypothetical protein
VRNEYEVYRHKNATDAEFEEKDKFFKQVELEDKELCNAAQVNLTAGMYSAGQLHPVREDGVLHFQKLIREAVKAHREEEKQAGTEIWPTRGLGASQNDDVQFCQDVAGCTATKELSDW